MSDDESIVQPIKPKRNRQKFRSPIVSSLRLLDIQDVVDFTRCAEKTIERLLTEDDFPRPIYLREDAKRTARRWTLASVEAWVRRKEVKADSRIE